MEQITFDSLRTVILVLLAIAGAVVTIGKASDTIRSWRKPKVDKDQETEKQLTDHQKMLDTDKRRLDAHEEQFGDMRDMSRAMCQALKALLMHEINGNSVDKLRAANDKLDAYLIDAGGK